MTAATLDYMQKLSPSCPIAALLIAAAFGLYSCAGADSDAGRSDRPHGDTINSDAGLTPSNDELETADGCHLDLLRLAKT